MKVQIAIQKRRSYRGLDPVEITDKMISELAGAASLAPSCYNNQPWKFIFIKSKEKLVKMKQVMNKGNEWTFDSSCIVAVMSKRDLLLKATEMGLVAHVIAGYSPEKTKEILSVPEEWCLIALIALGKKSKKKQIISDEARPERLALKYVYSIDEYSKKLNKKVLH